MNILANETNKATIVDVAKMAGVSIKTVSRVANGQPHVREATRKKVQRAIDLLGYSANPYAKYMGSQSRPPVRNQLGAAVRLHRNSPSIANEPEIEDESADLAAIHAPREVATVSGDRDIDWW